MRLARVTLGLVLSLGLGGLSFGCATVQDQLTRSQRAFEASEHERALALLRDLEPDMHRLTAAEQAHYGYLRGMSDYRIGHRADARHWLGLASTYEEATPGVFPTEWKARLVEALAELNGAVHEDVAAALHGSPDEDAAEPREKTAKKKAKGRAPR